MCLEIHVCFLSHSFTTYIFAGHFPRIPRLTASQRPSTQADHSVLRLLQISQQLLGDRVRLEIEEPLCRSLANTCQYYNIICM